jgi:hypothetical protein
MSLEHTTRCTIWGSHSGGYEEYNLLGYKAVLSVECQQTFRRNISPPYSACHLLSHWFITGHIFSRPYVKWALYYCRMDRYWMWGSTLGATLAYWVSNLSVKAFMNYMRKTVHAWAKRWLGPGQICCKLQIRTRVLGWSMRYTQEAYVTRGIQNGGMGNGHFTCCHSKNLKANSRLCAMSHPPTNSCL